MTTLLYGNPTHIVEFLTDQASEPYWLHIKGPWSEAECLRYVSERADRSCYPERYRVRAVAE